MPHLDWLASVRHGLRWVKSCRLPPRKRRKVKQNPVRIEQLETRSLLSGPDAVNDSYSALHGQTITETASTGVLANDVDYNNLTMSAVLETNPAQGTVTLNSDGSFTDVPATNFVGSDSFTYEATDADGASSPPPSRSRTRTPTLRPSPTTTPATSPSTR